MPGNWPLLDNALVAIVTPLGHVPGLEVVYRAATGTVSPYQLRQIKAETAANIERAKGPYASTEDKAVAVAKAQQEQESYLRKLGAHPDQASVLESEGVQGLVPKLAVGLGVALVVGVVALVLYGGFQLLLLRAVGSKR